MTRHEDVYYTCNGCGNRLGESPFEELDDHTKVTVVNTDPAAVEPEHKYDLCARCWLDVYAVLDKAKIKADKIAEKRLLDDATSPLYRHLKW